MTLAIPMMAAYGPAMDGSLWSRSTTDWECLVSAIVALDNSIVITLQALNDLLNKFELNLKLYLLQVSFTASFICLDIEL